MTAMIQQGAPLYMEIDIRDHCEIRITNAVDHDEPLVEATSSLSQNNLSELREQLRQDLDNVRKKLSSENSLSVKNASDVLSDLHIRGWRILQVLFGRNNMKKLMEASKICQQAFPAWDRPGWDPRSFTPGIFVVRTAIG